MKGRSADRQPITEQEGSTNFSHQSAAEVRSTRLKSLIDPQMARDRICANDQSDDASWRRVRAARALPSLIGLIMMEARACERLVPWHALLSELTHEQEVGL